MPRRLGSTFLSVAFFVASFAIFIGPVRALGAPAEGARISMIDPGDVASAAAAVLTEDGYDGKTYTLTGPEAITYGRVAEEFSIATDRRVGFVAVPDEASRQGLIEAGTPEFPPVSATGRPQRARRRR